MLIDMGRDTWVDPARVAVVDVKAPDGKTTYVLVEGRMFLAEGSPAEVAAKINAALAGPSCAEISKRMLES